MSGASFDLSRNGVIPPLLPQPKEVQHSSTLASRGVLGEGRGIGYCRIVEISRGIPAVPLKPNVGKGIHVGVPDGGRQ